ncbi:hypothetical protein STEG23_036496 [Scotinomys teguina]
MSLVRAEPYSDFHVGIDEDTLTAEEPTVAVPDETCHTFEGADGASPMEKPAYGPALSPAYGPALPSLPMALPTALPMALPTALPFTGTFTSRTKENYEGILMEIVLNLCIDFSMMANFTLLILLIHEHWTSFHLLISSSLISLKPELGNNLDAFQWKNGERKCDTYTVEYYLGVKNNDLMKFADKWMEPETIILREENEGIQVRNLKNTGQMRYLKKKAKSSRRFVPRKRFSAVSHDHTE